MQPDIYLLATYLPSKFNCMGFCCRIKVDFRITAEISLHAKTLLFFLFGILKREIQELHKCLSEIVHARKGKSYTPQFCLQKLCGMHVLFSYKEPLISILYEDLACHANKTALDNHSAVQPTYKQFWEAFCNFQSFHSAMENTAWLCSFLHWMFKVNFIRKIYRTGMKLQKLKGILTLFPSKMKIQ